jgi:hypothetical protein
LRGPALWMRPIGVTNKEGQYKVSWKDREDRTTTR